MKENGELPAVVQKNMLSKLILLVRILFLLFVFGQYSYAASVSESFIGANDAVEVGTEISFPSPEKINQDSKILIRGTIKDAEGLALPGVNVLEKGTYNGVITDLDGKYSIEVSAGAVLTFSFIGFKTQNVEIGNRVVIDIVLEDDAIGLDEVVVVAMGVTAEKKKLNFAVQTVNSEDIMAARHGNFVQSLQGNIAGVEVSSTGGSPTASSQIIIRGISSINPSQNNEPIFILNGMHVSGGATRAAEINPNDIESVTVLKGAAAAALYGQEASNGAIIITTKKGVEGDIRVEVSATLQIDEAFRVPQVQRKYLRGSQGVYREQSMGGWGPLAPEGTKIYNNADNFLGTGVYQKYDISISGGSSKLNTYSSASYVKHEGIVPNDFLTRWNVMFKSIYKVTDNLTMDFMANMVERESRGFGASMGSVYSWPIDDDMRNYKNPDGSIRWLYINSENYRNSPMNPNWSRYEDTGLAESNRTLLQGTITWDVLKDLKITGRVSYDLTNSESKSITTPRWPLEPGATPTPEDYPYLGAFSYSDGNSSVVNGGIMINYSRSLNENLKLEFLAGLDAKRTKGRSVGMGGRHFIVPEWESIMNLGDIRRENITMGRTERNMYGYFGEMKFDYKGMAQFGVTARNDHSSTLPVENRSYYYPSFSGGVIFSELFQLSSNNFNYGKLRANWAKVGKDAPLYRLNKWFKAHPHPDGGYGVDPTRSSNPQLKPEMTTSWEIGVDTRLFGDRTKLDFAFYSTSVEDQIVEVRVSPASGNILQVRNEGTITNRGIEFIWDQSIIRKPSLNWNVVTNFGLNRGKVDALPDDIVEVYHHEGRHGNIATTAYLGGSTMALSGTDYLRNKDGKVIVDENGYPKINASPSLLIGNREADFTVGVLNKVEYKKWSLAMMLNMRKGGDVANITLRGLMSNGQARIMEDYRNRLVLIDGVVHKGGDEYVANTKPVVYDQTFHNNYVATVGSNFVEDGSFIRLGYVTLGYDLSNQAKYVGMQALKLSVTGRNLFLITSYRGSDPLVNYTGTSGGTGTFGVDYYNTPITKSFSFNLSATF